MADGKETPNIGETGLQSIRINGFRIDELPIAEQHEAKDQLRLAEDEDRKKRIKEVIVKFPPYQLNALRMQVKMSQQSIDRAMLVIAQNNQTISEYQAHIALCEHRDRELKNLGVELNKK